MSPQADYVVSNGTGAAVRSDINGQLAAIVSNNSGASAPATTYAYMLWADTSTNLLKLRNGANSAWITVGDLTAANLGLAALASPTFTGTATIPTLTVSTAANIPLGSAASPTLYFTGDSNTGLYSPGADQVALSTGGTGRLFIDSSGRCGIGTSSPGSYNSDASNLVIAGTGLIGATISSTNSGNSSIYFADGTTGNEAYRGVVSYAHSTDSMQLWTASTERIRIDSSGRVGIGTTSPQKTLSVSKAGAEGVEWSPGQSSNLNTEVHYNRSGSAFCGISTQAAYHIFDLASSEAARIDSSGRWLLGTSTSRENGFIIAQHQVEGVTNSGASISVTNNQNSVEGAYLVFAKSRAGSIGGTTIVQSSDDIGLIRFAAADGTDTQSIAAEIACKVDGTPGVNDTPGRLTFSTTADGASSPTERLRIANNGAWGLAGANYGSSGQVLTSNGSGSAPTWSTASGGKILQVVSTTKTDSFSTTSSTFVDVTGLSATITPTSASSKVLVIVSVNAGGNPSGVAGFKLVRGTTDILRGDAAGSRERVSFTFYQGQGDNGAAGVGTNYLDSPATTSSITYKITMRSNTGGQTVGVNRTVGDSDSASTERCTSTITLMEVAA